MDRVGRQLPPTPRHSQHQQQQQQQQDDQQQAYPKQDTYNPRTFKQQLNYQPTQNYQAVSPAEEAEQQQYQHDSVDDLLYQQHLQHVQTIYDYSHMNYYQTLPRRRSSRRIKSPPSSEVGQRLILDMLPLIEVNLGQPLYLITLDPDPFTLLQEYLEVDQSLFIYRGVA